MMFVIKRIEDGKYVTNPGTQRSYTSRLEDARIFPDRDQAEKDACGNERVHAVKDILGMMR